MKKITLFLSCLALLLQFAVSSAQTQNAQSRSERLAEYVYYFASDSLKGRGSGTVDAIKARDYIIERYKECGVKPFFNGDFVVRFETKGTTFTDAVGVIEGNELKDEYIVLGAHFDHLGVKKGEIYPGADDNASGSAALIEIARELAANRGSLKRSVIIAAFDGEELGLYGSNYLADFLDTVVGIDKVKLMMSIDMVGWYGKSGKLIMEGVATIRDGKKIVRESAERNSIKVQVKDFENSIFTATDTEGFAKKQVPTLAVTTGLKSPYHKPGDKPELIDYEGLDKVSGYLADFAGQVASDPDFAASGKVARKHMDEAPAFLGGVIGSIGGSSLTFPSASIGTVGRMDYTAGLVGRLNFGNSGIQVEALFEQASSRFPSLDQPLGRAQDYTQRAITVPAYFLVKTDSAPSAMFAGFGGYYSRVLSSVFSDSDPGWAVKPNQGGFAAVFGMDLGGILVQWDFRWQLGSAFDGPQPARLSTGSYLTLGWMF